MLKNLRMGHFAAFITVVIWGTTFISTKLLLEDFQPVEILFIRFVIGYVALCLMYPKRFHWKGKKQEILFAGAGLCGICLYYLLENIALTYTMASNVGVIISIAPFFTALLSRRFMKQEEPLHLFFFIGFAVAMVGICMISFQGSLLKINPIGDLLAVCAAFIWAIYSILVKKISALQYPTIQTTRRCFFYGLVWMIPTLCFFDVSLDVTKLFVFQNFGNLLFLGLGASAACFVSWNYAVKELGAVKTSVYIYMVPVITVVTSMLVLNEQIGIMAGIGTFLTLVGLCLSECKWKKHKTLKNTMKEEISV